MLVVATYTQSRRGKRSGRVLMKNIFGCWRDQTTLGPESDSLPLGHGEVKCPLLCITSSSMLCFYKTHDHKEWKLNVKITANC